jgi:cytochrome P450
VEKYIQERELQHQKGIHTEESYGFLDQVAQESGSIERLRDQLLNVLLAGRDTTACCLSWTMYVLFFDLIYFSGLTDALGAPL